MKSISIIEINYHPEVLRNLCLYLKDTDLEVKIFTTERIWSDVAIFNHLPTNFKLFRKSRTKSVEAFFEQHKGIWNQSDILLFNTLASHFNYFSKQIYSPVVILRVHNMNAYFGSLYSYRPKLSAFYLWKDFSFIVRKILLQREWFYKKRFLDKVDYFSFPNSIITKEALDRPSVARNKVMVDPLPFIHAEKVTEKISSKVGKEVTIGIIGAIDRRRRDYALVYNAFKNITGAFDHQVQLVFLGASSSNYGKSIKNKFKSLENSKFVCKFFDGFIDENTFTSNIAKIDFFILPLIVDTRYGIFREKYGKTKISGNINDLIKYGKPAIIPEEYSIEDSLSELLVKYRNVEDLSRIIKTWVNTKNYKEKSSTRTVAEHNFEKSQSKTLTLLQEMIGNKQS